MNRTAVFIIFSLMLVCPMFSFTEDDLKLEGVVYEENTPEESIAVINGNFLKAGDLYQSYRVTTIESSAVTLMNEQSGIERHLVLAGTGKRTSSAITPGASKSPAPAAGKSETDSAGAAQAVSSPAAGAWDPTQYLFQAREVAALADLKQLHAAASAAYSEMGPGGDISIERLIESGALSPAFASGEKGNYRFRVQTEDNGIVANADPMSGGAESLHYCIDSEGDVRAQKGSPASPSSPLYMKSSALRMPIIPIEES